MKSKIKKRCIITVILILIILSGSFIIFANKEKITNWGINGSMTGKNLTSENIKEELINENNSQYDSIENGEIILIEYCGDEESAVVPKELDGRKITKIDPNAFINKNILEKIKIPVEIAKNVEEIVEFKKSEELSDKEYTVYVTTKEYTEGYLIYMQLPEEEKAKVQAIPPKFQVVEDIEEYSLQRSEPIDRATIPSHYDLRSRISIPVKEQGELGICYAHVCTLMTETNLALRGISRNESEIHMAVKSGRLGKGGNYTYMWENYWKYGYGPVNEVGNTLLQQPYLTSVRGSNALAGRVYNACKSATGSLSAADVAAIDSLNPGQEHFVMSLKYFQNITGAHKRSNSSAVTTNRNTLKQAIMTNGAIYASIADPNNGNIYVDQGTRAMMYCPSNAYADNHAVSIIGWDDNFNKSYFPSSWGVTQNGAWIVQNSWGPNSGNNDGTFWISYQDYWIEAYNCAIGELAIGRPNVANLSISLANTSYTYDGKSKTPAVTVKYNNTTCKKDMDYTVSYSNNINPGTATVTIKGKGRFTGTATRNFTIKSQTKSISSTTITLGTSAYTYDGAVKKPTVKVVDGSTTLTNGTHYTVSYSNNVNAGTATVTITGKGNYTGSTSKTFKINPKAISGATATLATSSYIYDGTAKTPAVTVKDGNLTLTNGTHYTVSYSNNTNAGTATAIVTGKGNYSGNITKTFTITQKSINGATVTIGVVNGYDGTAKTPAVTIKDGNLTLTNGTHYTVSYSNNTNVGTATITITGKGNYTGTITKSFTIEKGTIKLNITETTHTYDGAEHTIKVDVINPQNGTTIRYGLEQGKYTLTSIPKFTEIGTYNIYYKAVSTDSNYNELEGVQKLTIEAVDLSTTNGAIDVSEYVYDGIAKTPKFTIKQANYTLRQDTDYTISYTNNINAGEATITATGKGNYKGTLAKKFIIKPQDLSNGTTKLINENIVYNKKEQTPEVEVKDSFGKILEKDKDYKITYSNNINVGTATYTVTGNNNYTGTITKEFTIEKGNMEYIADDVEVVYDGKEHGVTVEMIIELPKVDIKFGTSQTECNLENTPTYTEAGSYKIYYTISAENYRDKSGVINLVIKPKDIKTSTISEIVEKYKYTASEITPTVEVKDEAKTLILNKDYTISYQNNINAGTAFVIVNGIGNYTGINKAEFEIEKGDPNYIIPSGIITYYGAKLENVKLPTGFKWEDDLKADVGEIGNHTFKCSYIPEDTSNYNIITGIEVTIKVTDKLVVNIEKYVTKLVENENKEEIIYINGIMSDEKIEDIKNAIETNGEITFYEKEGTEIKEENSNVKTGIRAKIKTEAEEVEYILVVTR